MSHIAAASKTPNIPEADIGNWQSDAVTCVILHAPRHLWLAVAANIHQLKGMESSLFGCPGVLICGIISMKDSSFGHFEDGLVVGILTVNGHCILAVGS